MTMKNKLLILVLILFFSCVLKAQITNIRYTRFKTEEQLFGNTSLYTTPVNFTFVNNQNKAVKISFEMYAIHQLINLPNLDSILNEAKQNLSYFVDSFKNDAIVRSIDYLVLTKMAPQFKINNNNYNSANFTLKNNELVELKINSDTLRIKLYTLNNINAFKTYPPEGLAKGDQNFPFYINIIVNNLNDIKNLPDTILTDCIKRIRKDVDHYLNEKSEANYFSHYNAVYNMKNGIITPLGTNKSIRGTYLGPHNQLELGMNYGFRFLSGAPVTHIAVGLLLREHQMVYSLTYELNGFYSKDNLNRMTLSQNNFLSIGFAKSQKNKNLNEFHIVPSMSIGKLIHREGDWLPENTYRFGWPAVAFGSLHFQPELYFGKFEGQKAQTIMPAIKFSIYNF